MKKIQSFFYALIIFLNVKAFSQELPPPEPGQTQYQQDNSFYAMCTTDTRDGYFLVVETRFSLKTYDGQVLVKWQSYDPYKSPHRGTFQNVLTKNDIELKKVGGRKVFVIKSEDEVTGDSLKIKIPTQFSSDPSSTDLSEVLFNDYSGEMACSNESDSYKQQLGLQ